MNKPVVITTPVALLLLLVAQVSGAEDYASGVVIGAAELAEQIGVSDPAVVVLDMRPPDSYAAGHVPGARLVTGVADFRKLFDGSGGTADYAASPFHALFGTNKPQSVALYGEATDPNVARAWWQLRYLGIDGAMVLNGGWRAWESIKGPVEAGSKPIVYHGLGFDKPFVVNTQPTLLVEGQILRKQLGQGATPILIDARSEREYAAGCVPGAKRLEWSELVNAKSGKLLPADELREKFASIGVDPKEPTISYCRSGGRASVTVLALAALGSEQVANYYGSWTEWQAAGGPVQSGDAGQ